MRRPPSTSPPPSPPLPEVDEDFPSDEEPPLPDEEDYFNEVPSEEEFSDEPPPSDDENPPSNPEIEDDFDDEPDDDNNDDLSLPSEDPSSDQDQPGIKKSFVLPVPTANRSKIESDDSFSLKNNRVDQLTSGLIVKEPPQLLSKGGGLQRANLTEIAVSSKFESDVLPERSDSFPSHALSNATELISERFVRKQSFINKGFVEVKGRFDGDSFEDLLLSVNKESKIMEVVVETGDTATFDLSKRAFVFEDVEDPTTFILEFQRNIIIFKFASSETLINVMKNMPEDVFMAADLLKENEEDHSKEEEEQKKPRPQKQTPLKVSKASGGPKIDHVKGTSVEDILENDFETSAERQEKIEQMFQVRDSALASAVPVPKRRKELIETYIRKPKYSVRRVTLICEWLNALRVWPRKLMILNLHRELCSGMLLANVFKYLKPDVEYVNMHEKALVKKAALSNLDQVLGHIWRAKSLNNSRIPSADEIYSGNTSKTAILLNELFAVYILRPLYKNSLKILRWYHNILKQYQRPLPEYIFEDGDLAGVWPHFQSGTALFCILYHFYGATSIGTGSGVHHVDPLRIAGDPTSICDFRSNLTYVFHLLGLLEIDVLWTAEDWISNPDTEFIMFQLSIIYDKLKDKQCTLPPAHGDKPGLTSGPNGDALVIGLIFSDAPANIKFLPKTRKAVRLGHDEDSMPLLPVDQNYVNPRFTAGGVLPQGMISKNAKISQIVVDLRETKGNGDRFGWNARTTVDTSKDNFVGAHLQALLREQHKLSADDNTDQYSTNASHVGRIGGKRLSQHSAAVGSMGKTKVDSTSQLPDPLKPYQDITKEINQMVKALEEEMKAARDKIKEFEEDLADRYLQLEESAQACSAIEYEMALQDLDKERSDLELEKKRLQDYFTRKFAFIRERKDNAQAAQQTVFTEINSVQHSHQNIPKATTGKSVAKKESKKGVDLKTAEKGWISLSSAKPNTHNFHLRNKQSLSMQNFKTKITPKNLLDREKRDGKSELFKSYTETQNYSNELKEEIEGQLQSQGEGTADAAFQKFKLRLHLSTQRFLDAKNNKVRPRIQDIMNAGPKPLQVELISLPNKSAVDEVDNTGLAHFKNVRAEEIRMMNYEDERRKIFLAERSLEQSLTLSQQLFQNATTAVTHAYSPETPHVVNSNNLVDGVGDIDAAFAFLAKPRVLLMNDRSPKEYTFCLVNLADEGAEDEIKFALEWTTSHETSLQFSTNSSGLVLITDFISIQVSAFDPNLFVIAIRETPRALKNSKGRTAVTVRCSSAAESAAYVSSFTTLLNLSL